MGTRHFIGVQLDGEYKIAQYGQWDGYPSGQGLKVLHFIAGLNLDAYADFVEKVRAARFLSKEDVEAINARIAAGEFPGGWQRTFPHLSRDAGADILGMVATAPAGIALKDSRGFPADSLFCEYAYVIDLDARTLEVFEGFNKQPLAEGERFYGWVEKYPGEDCNASYHPVRLVAKWPLGDLPSEEQFLATLCPPEEEEGEEEAAAAAA